MLEYQKMIKKNDSSCKRDNVANYCVTKRGSFQIPAALWARHRCSALSCFYSVV